MAGGAAALAATRPWTSEKVENAAGIATAVTWPGTELAPWGMGCALVAGAAFLAVVAIIPSIVSSSLGVNFTVASFYGGTGLLIVISVALDLVQKINSHLVMRNYPGLTED